MHDDRANKHGLKRSDFRDPDRRKLRQECGFGCVICGSALYEYAHVDPPFEDARTHNIQGMALLCSEHHDKLDKWKRLSIADVMRARANPAAKQAGSATENLRFTNKEFVLTIGSTFFTDCHRILHIEGVDVLRVDPPEASGEPHRITALFCDHEGALVANIVQNEVRYRAATWDVEIVGPKITFRSAPKKICLVLVTIPDKGLRIERIDMTWLGARVVADDQQVVVTGIAESKISLQGTMFHGCSHCISVSGGVARVGNSLVGGHARFLGGGVVSRKPRS